MFVLLINRVRDIVSQGSDAPVGTMRGMHWWLPVDRICTCPEEGLI